MESLDFLVNRKDVRQCRIEKAGLPALQPGQVRLRVDKFAFTANNVTYAVFGESMQYWNYFPAPDGWGRIPVWGFADVAESRCPELPVGERVYGYLPMSTHVVLQPAGATAAGFVDATEHRAQLPAAYQYYQRTAGAPGHEPRFEDYRALFVPLFFTSFLIEDFLSDNDLFGAEQVVIASASSKTALGVGFQLTRNRPRAVQVIGLTSLRNRPFCERLAYYDEILTYDALTTLKPERPTVYVDMAGDGKLLHAVHHHFHEHLKYSCIVGATHWEGRATQHDLPGAKPQFFFAPTRMVKRRKDWGPGGTDQRFGRAWARFLPSVREWLKVTHHRGPQAVESAYREVLEGRIDPVQGYMFSL
jgi:hypothetical protein